jgi:GNAT superfamily N-acetyltransferase
MIRLERVTDTLPAGFEALRAEARRESHSMLDTLASEWASGATRFDQPGEALFAAYIGESLAGIGGLTQDTAITGALRMRRFYVALAHRRAGVGRMLAAALLRESEAKTVTCNAASGSERFWEALGFVPDRGDGRTHLRAR